MEAPNQIMRGLGAFLAGTVAATLLVKGVLALFPTSAEYISSRICLGVFLLAWWASYLVIMYNVRKQKTRRRPESR